ncbi:MAG TPA: LEA type 2 family protein [Luteimonas sp.]|jgi:hypothetical protein|nr:LEA type 2 family protein [Luteimonas sp.]
MQHPARVLFALTAAWLLLACSTGPVRRVSEPAVNIQQLTVRADGSWSIDLRIDNYSSVPMRFDSATFAMTLGGQAAGTLRGQPALSIGPESADVATLSLAPASAAKIAIADALARNGSIDYALEGTLDAAPENGRVRSYDIKRKNTLSSVPGLAGVLR